MTIEFGAKSSPVEQLNVPALVIEVGSQTIREYLPLSDKIPLLVIFTQTADQDSDQLVRTVSTATNKASGKILTLIIDASKSPELAQAFEVTQLPSALGLLKGQPAPLFVGDQPADQVALVIERVIQVGLENGLSAQAVVQVKDPEPELSETHKQAFDAIENADYQNAKSLYEKALLENPNDFVAEAGLAQVKLLIRLEGKDLATLAATLENDLDSVLLRIDALVATGRASEGFDALLELFANTQKDSREPIRLRFVELFQIVGNDNKEVIEARKKLSLLLF
jgi:putative thioredoxin